MFMKIILSAFLIAISIQLTKAQTVSITGSVQDEDGRLLHFVSIGDSKYETTVYTDSVGTFTIAMHPDSKLRFELEGYRDTVIAADKINQVVQIVLKPFVSVPIETTHISMHVFRTESGLVSVPRPRLNTTGSRYLFDTFAHGFLTDKSGKQIISPYYLFDYEKMSGYLLLTVDKKNILSIEKDQVKAFTLYNNADQRFDFESVPAIDKSHYVQVLASGSKYKIYKLIRTTFSGADFENTASGGAGHDDDQYNDDVEYYVLNLEHNQLKKLELKKRSIKEDFDGDADKVNKFFTGNSGKIDDSYLSTLGDYMNK